MEQLIQLLLILLFMHFIFDFPLQGQYLATMKDRKFKRPAGEIPWVYAMFVHSFLHALSSAVVLMWFGVGTALIVVIVLAETVWHFLFDMSKCSGNINLATDQIYHVVTKILIAMIAVGSLP